VKKRVENKRKNGHFWTGNPSKWGFRSKTLFWHRRWNAGWRGRKKQGFIMVVQVVS